MGIGTRMFRLGAVLPGIVLSAALLSVVSAMLPATLGGLLLVAYAIAAVVLAAGALEETGVEVLGRARRATPGEEQLLQGIAVWLVGQGQQVPDLYVARSDHGHAAAEPVGRHSAVVAPRMLGWLHRQQVSEAVVATVVAQAAAGLRVGPSRFDLAVRLLTAPGALVVAGFLRVARWVTWVPGVLGFWRIRAVFGIVAAWQCLQAHQVTVAVTTAVLVTVPTPGRRARGRGGVASRPRRTGSWRGPAWRASSSSRCDLPMSPALSTVSRGSVARGRQRPRPTVGRRGRSTSCAEACAGS